MSNNTIKLLIYGSGNVNPINIVIENLKKYGNTKYHIDGLNLWDKKEDVSYYGFNTIYKIKKFKVSEISRDNINKFRTSLLKDRAIQNTLLKLFIKLKFKTALKFFNSTIEEEFYLQQHLEVFKLYDVINVHFIREEYAKIVALAPKDVKVVLSFWGSDLMANSGAVNYIALSKAVERADIITVSTIEMREIFLSKFGRHYSEKIRYTFFGQAEDLFIYQNEQIKKIRSIGEKLLLDQGFNSSQFKYIIKVGYNGFKSQNHLLILDQLNKLPAAFQKEILLVIPLTYGAEPDYIQIVKSHSKRQNLAACVLEQYLTRDEALAISFICDVMLNLRDNDGFNNSMVETLFAGNILISGGWLPYSELRKHKVYFHEVYDIKDVADLLLSVAASIEIEKFKAKQNPEKVKNIVSGLVTGPQWDAVYKEVLDVL